MSDISLARELQERGIRDERVLAAIARLSRSNFVPAQVAHLAEGDFPLEIGHGQTIGQPYVVAFMSEALALRGSERVLEIGTGSGYQTAVLAGAVPGKSFLLRLSPRWRRRLERGLPHSRTFAFARATVTGVGQKRLRLMRSS